MLVVDLRHNFTHKFSYARILSTLYFLEHVIRWKEYT
jgi:hypothetical protein